MSHEGHTGHSTTSAALTGHDPCPVRASHATTTRHPAGARPGTVPGSLSWTRQWCASALKVPFRTFNVLKVPFEARQTLHSRGQPHESASAAAVNGTFAALPV